MSREIKFRAWNGEQMVSPDYITRDGIGYWREDSIPCYSEDLMQFTGLKDKNGIDIYEGDILKHNKYKTTKDVEWNDGVGFECWIDNEDELDDLIGYQPQCLKVIGNIHENEN